MRRTIGTTLLSAAVLVFANLPGQAARSRVETTRRGPRWVMENDRVRVEIDPARGARIDRFVDKAFGRSVVTDPDTQGLFIDHLAHQDWPGELWERAYEATPLHTAGPQVAVEFSTTIEGRFRDKEEPQSRGLVLRKTFRLRDGERGVRVEHNIENPTRTPKRFSLWVQNLQKLGPDPKENVAVRPAVAGVYRFKMLEQPRGESWSRYLDSTDAWTGVVDPVSGQGIIYFQDWDYLDAHYNAGKAFTVEWFMSPIILPPGKSWSTNSQMISRRMQKDVVGVSPDLWVGASLTKDESGIRFTIACTNPRTPVGIEGTLHAPRDGKQFPLSLTLRTGRHVVPLPKGCRPPIFLCASVSPKRGPTLRVNEFLGGRHFPKNEPLPGYPPLFKVEPPERHPTFPRPDVIELNPAGTKRVLVVQGPLTLGMGIRQAVEASGYEVRSAYEVLTSKESAISGFPTLYDDLLAVGTIVFNNVDANLLSPIQRQLLDDYLRAGGSLMTVGGTATARVNWPSNPLRKLMTMEPHESFAPVLTTLKGRAKGDAAIVRLLPSRAFVAPWNPRHARIVASLGGCALIALENVGKGRVLALGLSGLGTPAPPGYWQSKPFRMLMGRLLALLHETP